MVSFGFLDDEVSPVDGDKPADNVNRCQQLDESNRELRLVNVLVTETGAQHSARAWKYDVQNQANVGVHVADFRHVNTQLPDAQVLRTDLHHAILHVVQALTHIFRRDAECLGSCW